MSSKKRTKQQKQQAEVRRLATVATLPNGQQAYQLAGNLVETSPKAKVVTAEKILGYNLPVLYRDLAKTAGVAAVVLGVLVGLVVFTPYF